MTPSTRETPLRTREMCRPAISRRRFGALLACFGAGALAGRPLQEFFAADRAAALAHEASADASGVFDAALERLLPAKGVDNRIALGDAVLRLIDHGVIDRDKFIAHYERRSTSDPSADPIGWRLGSASENKSNLAHFRSEAEPSPLGPAEKLLLSWPATEPILLTRSNADIFLNLLWPLGLSNFLEMNKQSPVLGGMLPRFASTAGWTLGREPNGAGYFNRFPIVPLAPAQEALAVRVAESAYRPCCNNSTFFQDCNHGAALFGLLQLGAAQGLTEDELYEEAFAFNAHWFPDQYAEIALYFTFANGRDWSEIDPRIVMSFDYSSIGAWQKRVHMRLANYPGLLPIRRGGPDCSV